MAVSRHHPQESTTARRSPWPWAAAVLLVVPLLLCSLWWRGLTGRRASAASETVPPGRDQALPPVGATVSRLHISTTAKPQAPSASPPAPFRPDCPEVVVAFAWRAPARCRFRCQVAHERRPVPALSGGVDTSQHRSGTAVFRLRRPSAGWPEGRYEVAILCGNAPLAQGAFTVQKEAAR